jgi:hypothetical protein
MSDDYEAAASSVKAKAEEFVGWLRSRGFKGCPCCGNTEDFTWMQNTVAPDATVINMHFWFPGQTTMPKMLGVPPPATMVPYPFHLILLVCDNCAYTMPFSDVHWRAKR